MQARSWLRASPSALCLGWLVSCAGLEFADESAVTPPGVAGSTSVAGREPSGGGGSGAGAPNAGAPSLAGTTHLAGSSTSPGGAPAEGGTDAGGAGGASEATCPSAGPGTVRASVHPELSDAVNSELHPFVLVSNDGAPLKLSRLKVRYYFSAEHLGDWDTACYWVTPVDGATADATGRCQMTRIGVQTMSSPTTDADSYLELSFPDAGEASLGGQSLLELRSGFWLKSRQSLTQTNDYSFAPSTEKVTEASGFPYRETSRVTLYVDGQLAWGTEPCVLP